MSKKTKADNLGFVYSTNPDFHFEQENSHYQTLLPGQLKLKIRLDSKHRAGKSVTLVEGFSGKAEDLDMLCRKLKSYCGTGGSAKDGIIIIQGDQRVKIIEWLKKNGYPQVKSI